MNRSARRALLFESRTDFEAFVEILRESVRRHGIALYAYCVMPNHWHLVASVDKDNEMSRFLHWLTMKHARRWQTAKRTRGEGAVYQGRYRAIPVSGDVHFLRLCRYVERNALRASLVNRAEDLPWNSLAVRCTNSNATWLAKWPILQPSNWVDFVNQPQSDAEVRAIREAIVRGKGYGGNAWRKRLETSLGVAPRRARGRPPRSVHFK